MLGLRRFEIYNLLKNKYNPLWYKYFGVIPVVYLVFIVQI